MINIKVSIIIPIYNVASYIESCLMSVLNQTYNNVEIILINDCTPDDSMKIVSQILRQLQIYKDVMIINHEVNKGLSAARNTGISAATGDYLYFLDSDDELSLDCISKLIDIKGGCPDIDCICAGFNVVGADHSYPIKSNLYLDSNTKILIDYLQYKWPVMACNKLISKRLFDSGLCFKEGLLHEDELFSFDLACMAKSMICIPDKTYIYKVRVANAITSSIGYRNIESMYRINKYRYKVLSHQLRDKGVIDYANTFIITTTLILLKLISNNKNINRKEKRLFIIKFANLFFKYLSFKSSYRFKDYLRIVFIYTIRLRYTI